MQQSDNSEHSEAPQYEAGKSPLIKNLMAGLPEIGKIKIGRKGDLRQSQSGTAWRAPVKLDHFIVTKLDRDQNDNFIQDAEIMKILGSDKPKKIPIRLLFDSIEGNFQSRYTCYNGKTLWCSGDGEAAFRQEQGKPEKACVKCPCGRQLPEHKGKDKCKMNGRLSCIIDGADLVGGVWVYRTTGYNSTVGIMSSLALIRTMTGGFLAGLDLDMTVQPKVATDPEGKSVTIQVVGVVFRGSMQQLQKKTLEIATNNAQFRARLAHVAVDVQKLIGVDADAIDQAGDITEEFYPEEVDLVPPGELKPVQAAATVQVTPVQAATQSATVQASVPAPVAAAQTAPTAAPAAAPVKRTRKTAQAVAPTAAPAAVVPEAAPVATPEAAPEDLNASAPLAQPVGAVDYELFD